MIGSRKAALMSRCPFSPRNSLFLLSARSIFSQLVGLFLGRLEGLLAFVICNRLRRFVLRFEHLEAGFLACGPFGKTFWHENWIVHSLLNMFRFLVELKLDLIQHRYAFELYLCKSTLNIILKLLSFLIFINLFFLFLLSLPCFHYLFLISHLSDKLY